MRASLIFNFIMIALAMHMNGQERLISLTNPSFEDIPHKGGSGNLDIGVAGWYDCGRLMFPGETPPDIHPVDYWEVRNPASDGQTYLGMVIRDNDTWESVSQRLKTTVENGKCYEFSIDLARSRYYISGSKVTMKTENYNRPAVLRIWGGTGVCGQQELLAESSTVTNNDWQLYTFKFEPAKNLSYLTLEAFYEVPVLFPYNGHVLLDNASAIKEIACNEEDQLAVIAPSPAIRKDTPTPRINAVPAQKQRTEEPNVEVAANTSPVKREKLLKELSEPLREGQIIRVHSIYFQADSSVIKDESMQALDEIYEFLKSNKDVIIEIGGHTSTVPKASYCDNLSSERAKAVAFTLIRKGISPNRVQFKGYGKRLPIIWNDRFDLQARQKNQRVEIKILSLS